MCIKERQRVPVMMIRVDEQTELVTPYVATNCGGPNQFHTISAYNSSRTGLPMNSGTN